MKYDLIVYGGGTSGLACAYISAKKGIKTLLVERTDVLGGSITQALVVPCMKVNSQNINTEFIDDLKLFADKYHARHTYQDGNELWFNPELLKLVFDDMLSSVKCTVLFSTSPCDIYYDKSSELFTNYLSHKTLSLYIESKYIIDATAEGKIFQILNCDFQKKSEIFQETQFCPVLATQSRVSQVARLSRVFAGHFWQLVREWKVQSRGLLRDFGGSARDSLAGRPSSREKYLENFSKFCL